MTNNLNPLVPLGQILPGKKGSGGLTKTFNINDGIILKASNLGLLSRTQTPIAAGKTILIRLSDIQSGNAIIGIKTNDKVPIKKVYFYNQSTEFGPLGIDSDGFLNFNLSSIGTDNPTVILIGDKIRIALTNKRTEKASLNIKATDDIEFLGKFNAKTLPLIEEEKEFIDPDENGPHMETAMDLWDE